MLNKKPVARIDFVRGFMRGGLNYKQATIAYESLCKIMEDAVVNGERIKIGKVCSLSPRWRAPKEVTMSFEKTPGGIKKTRKTYFLGHRIRYAVNIYDEFLKNHEINWFANH